MGTIAPVRWVVSGPLPFVKVVSETGEVITRVVVATLNEPDSTEVTVVTGSVIIIVLVETSGAAERPIAVSCPLMVTVKVSRL